MDRTAGMVTSAAAYRTPPGEISFKLGEGYVGGAAASGKPVRLNHAGATGGARYAVLIVPVAIGGEIAAVISLNGALRAGGFTPEDERRAMEMATEFAPQIRRSLRLSPPAEGPREWLLGDLVPPGLLKEVQDSCSALLGVPCSFEDARGRCLAPISGAPDFCVLLRSRPGPAVRCELSMARAMTGGPPEQVTACECHAGVMTLVAPIVAGGTVTGSLVAMLRYQKRDSAVVRAMASDLGLDPYEALARASMFPSVPAEREESIRVALEMTARMVSAIAGERLNALREQSRVQRALDEVQSLRQAAQGLSGVGDLSTLLDRTLRQALAVTGAVAGDITLLSPDQQLELAAQTGLPENIAEMLTHTVSDSPGCAAITTCRRCLVADLGRENRFPGWTQIARRQPGLGAALAVPMGARDRAVGALTVYLPERGAPSEETIALLGALGDQAALAIRSVQATARAAANEASLRTFLSRMTRGLGSSLDSMQLLQWVVDFGAEMTGAPHCVLYELTDDELQVRAIARSGRTVIEKAALLPGEGLSGRVVVTGTLVQSQDLSQNPEFVTSAAALPADASQYIGVPLLYGGDLLGVLAVYSPPREYSDDDLQLLGTFAGQAAAAIQNARSFERQREIALTMQESFLPRERLRIPGLEVGHVHQFAEETVGGDYYDTIPMNEHTAAVVLGDVSGKGIRAATITAMGKYVLRSYAFEDPEPASVLDRMNAVLADQMDAGTFITLFYGLIDVDRMEIRYANGGHPEGLLYRPSSGDFTAMRSTGMMVGAMPGERFEMGAAPLQRGDLIVLYTDGVLEARRGSELFGGDRLRRAIAEVAEMSAGEIAASIYQKVKEFHTSGPSDDVCILVVRVHGVDPDKSEAPENRTAKLRELQSPGTGKYEPGKP